MGGQEVGIGARAVLEPKKGFRVSWSQRGAYLSVGTNNGEVQVRSWREEVGDFGEGVCEAGGGGGGGKMGRGQGLY